MRILCCLRRRRRLRQLPLRPDSSVYSFLTLLEDQPDAKLDLTWRRALCQVGNLSDAGSDRGAAGIQSQIPVRRSVPILDIKDIECFNSQLHLKALTDGHALEHRQVNVVNGRSSEGVARQVAERARVIGDAERTRIKPTDNRVYLIGCSAALRDCLLT